MLKKFASVLIAASMLTTPAFVQGAAARTNKAMTVTTTTVATPAGSTITTKVIKKHRNHVKHVRHAKRVHAVKHVRHGKHHVRTVKKIRHHHAVKTVVAKPLTAPVAAPSRTN